MARISRAVGVLRSGNLLATLDNHRRENASTVRRLLPHPVPGGDGVSARRINALYRGLPTAAHYLEIGLHAGRTFEQVRLPYRIGVDPNPLFDLRRLPSNVVISAVTSDEFFEAASPQAGFDIVFLDGLHTYRQTYKDLINTLDVCPAGVIMVDDVVPSDEASAMPDQLESIAERQRRGLIGDPWHGDVYKVLLCIHEQHPELSVRTIMGSGNPQTLVWRDDVATPVSPIAVDSLVEIDNISYNDVFSAGPPDYFRPCAEDEAIADALSAVSARFSE